MKKIFIRSPYFIEIDEPGQANAKIEVFLWNAGDTEPTTPLYTLSKDVPNIVQNSISWNVANLAKEFIKPIFPNPVSVPTEENPDTWCYMKVISYSDDVEVADETFVCLNGYTLYPNGYNYSTTETIVPLANTDINLTTFSGFSYINVWIEESNDFLWQGNDDYLFTTSTPSLWKLPYDYDLYILLYDGGDDIFKINTEQLCEPKYTPITCTYVNRFGGWQFLTFFKASSSSIEVTSKDFNLMPSSIDYNVYKGQKQRFNFQGKQKVICNTGWVDENYFELIQDLLLSETVLLGGQPAIVKSQTSDVKTYIKDKNINYTIEFEYNYGLINDVI
jgi:hypothetical protein